MKRAAIIYESETGNTEKVAFAIKIGLERTGVEVSIMKPGQAKNVDFFNFDLICIGSPSYRWRPIKTIDNLLMEKFGDYRKQGRVKLGSPRIGKSVLIFCTYSGPHTGLNEAIPVGKYMGQFFDHLGFNVLDEWYILSEFHGSEENSTMGRMGNIRGKPDVEDLKKITEDAEKLSREIAEYT